MQIELKIFTNTKKWSIINSFAQKGIGIKNRTMQYGPTSEILAIP